MALRHTIDEDRNLVTIVGEFADAAEWQGVLDRILRDPRLKPGCLILRDQRGGTKPVDAATVVAIMEVVRNYWHKLGVFRAAIVMAGGIDAPGLIAQALAAEDDMPIQAFLSAADALDWLTETAPTDRRRR